MKKVKLILFGMLFSLIALAGNAQNDDYFVGKWNFEIVGTPSGDTQSTLTFERKDGELGGTMESEGKALITFSRVELDGDEITAYFTSDSGYDVYFYLEKIDGNNAEGSMMDFFDATAKRIAEKEE
ncbi:MAG: hypothetical protein JKX79_00155 [Labilibaculum sp.]|nr:hypothetical protein [Labilibaculum sp.]